MFTLATTATMLSLLSSPAQSDPQHLEPQTESSTRCEPIPAGASQECIDCMNDQCDILTASLIACGDDRSCRDAARLAYELGVLSCDCGTIGLNLVAQIVYTMPESQQPWITEAWMKF